MFEVDCKDVTMIECTYVGKGATIDEVKAESPGTHPDCTQGRAFIHDA